MFFRTALNQKCTVCLVGVHKTLWKPKLRERPESLKSYVLESVFCHAPGTEKQRFDWEVCTKGPQVCEEIINRKGEFRMFFNGTKRQQVTVVFYLFEAFAWEG